MSDEEIAALVARHRTNGALVDANLLLLFLIGLCDVDLIPQFKRTRGYTEGDFETLRRLLGRFDRLLTTPNVATEISNLANHLREDWRPIFAIVFKERFAIMTEHYVPTAVAGAHEFFAEFGLTDAATTMAAAEGTLIISDDGPLCRLLGRLELPCINFTHLRDVGG